MTYGRHRRSRSRAPGWFAMACVVATLAVGLVVTPVATVPATATVPGQPGVTQPGTTVYAEDFENGGDNTATGAQSYSAVGSTPYVGAGGQTYTGSPSWINGTRCNGVILSYANTTTPVWAQSGTVASGTNNRCADTRTVRSYQFLRMLALAMGQQFTPGSPTTDHVDSSYTECQSTDTSGGTCDTLPSGQNNGVMFRTAQPIPVTVGHYYAFHVDTAYMNCNTASADPSYQAAWVDAANGVHTIGSPLDGCQTSTSPTVTSYTQSVTSAVGGAFGTVTKTVRINSFTTDTAFQATTSTLNLELWNNNGTTNGNDGAFDNVSLVDVTPQLDKSFSPTSIAPGGTSTLTFTVTNTSELTPKQDWSLTDALPAGLTVANPASVGGTCAASSTVGTPYAVTAAPGATSVSVVGGDLAAGQASCTITVQVTASVPGTYTNGPANVTTNLNPPGTATLTVTPTCSTPAPVYTVTGANGLNTTTNAPHLISYDATGAQLADVTLRRSNGTAFGSFIGDIAISPDGTKLYGITASTNVLAVPNEPPTIYVFDPLTGLQTGQVPTITGITWSTFSSVNSMSMLADGRLLIGSGAGTNSQNLYAINPATGAATLFATFPSGFTSGGDSITLPDGTVLLLAAPSVGTTTTLFRLNTATGVMTQVGSVPQSFGVTQIGGMVYLAGGDGKLRTLLTSSIPTTTSAATLTTTVVASLASGIYFGATSAQDSQVITCLNVIKTAVTVTGPDATGKFTATYTVRAVNNGTASSYGALTDTPAFSSNIALDSASWTGQSSGSATAPASGPFTVTLASAGTAIAAGATHTYNVSVVFHYKDAGAPSACAGPGTGLYNSVAVPTWQETVTTDDSACSTPPANINVVKTAGTTSGPDSSGNYTATYTVTVTNTGGTAGSYGALQDTPSFSPNLVPTSASWSGQSTGSATTPASGPFTFTLAPAATTIAAGATHTYTVVVTFHYSDSSQPLACNGSGTGLFNAVAVPAGQETVTTDDTACLPPPPRYDVYLRKTGKDASGATVALTGSAWQLQADSGGTPGAVIASGIQPVSGQPGEFLIRALAPGSYWLTETTAPTGYVLLAQPIGFVVSATGSVTVTSGGDSAISVGTAPGGQPEIVAGDPSPVKLPLTGGGGTQAFTILGVLLLAAAGIGALVVRRRSASGTRSGRRVRR